MNEKENLQSEENGSETELPPKITKENFNRGTSKKATVTYWAKCICNVLLSSLLVAFAAYCLITPNQFTIGGASGIAILINVATNGAISQGIMLFSINLPLIVLSFFFVKKKFAILSAMNICMQSIWLLLLEKVFQDSVKIEFASNGEKIFAAIGAGICIGVAVALAFKVGGSTGGADILAVLIQKKFAATSIAWMLFLINCVVICMSIFVFPGETPAETLLPVMMSAFEAYVEGKTNESMTNGFQSAIEFRIITDKPEEMANALMKELSRGVTSLPAKGMYTKKEHSMLLCVVNRRQVATLKRVMKAVDPDSFAVMANVSQVLGLGFYTNEMQ